MLQQVTKVDHKLMLEKYEQFSQREKEIIFFARHALTNKEIAEKLGITSSVVKRHLTMVYKTFNITSRRRINLAMIMFQLEQLYPKQILQCKN